MHEDYDTSQVSLLLVDDDFDFRSSVARRFVRRGYHVQEAADGEQALRLAGEKPCDVALVDLVMPGMTGLELLQTLKRRWPFLQVVIMTGQGSAGSASAATRLGAAAYLVKPMRLDDLEALVKRAYLFSRQVASPDNHSQRQIQNGDLR